MADYQWPAMDKRKLMGKRVSRLDGPVKSAGRAKFPSDQLPKDILYGTVLTSPHAHAKVVSVDTSEAEKMKGVTAVRVTAPAGTEVQWAGFEIAWVAASSEELANDAIRKIRVSYEVLPHVVREEDPVKAGDRARPAGEQLTGDPDKAFQSAEVVNEASYGIPVITHCTLEPHGLMVSWKGDQIEYWPSTQSLTDIGPDLARALKVDAKQIHTQQEFMGGGFGSKFQADKWGAEAAQLSKMSGGRPVRLFLDRATDLRIAGNRPSHFAKIKIGGAKDGAITAWQSESWSSGGFGGGGIPPIPYVFTNIPNRRLNHKAVSLNAGPQRAWRAPNHPQASFLTCTAIEDFAAKAGLDPMVVFEKNLALTARKDTYAYQLKKAAELAEWSKYWHPRGDGGKGHIKRGLGIGIATWGGAGHASKCLAHISADGTVEVELGSQDLGTGTRTIIAMVAGETLGLPLTGVKVKIGDNRYPSSGSSGGSTTVGGVSTSTRKACVNALGKLFEKVAPALGAPADQLEAVDGKIQVKGNPAKSLAWKAACAKIGAGGKISEMGENVPREAPKEKLNTGGVGGIQVADVSVDVDTGIVRMNRLVAVQDCGLIINPKTAESQIFGACIMSICAALSEERIMDPVRGNVLNPDMEFYKLAGISDIGEIVVHLDIRPENDSRGVIGLGEPPAVPGIAAISNAVANAIGVRVPMVPLTPRRVIDALERRSA